MRMLIATGGTGGHILSLIHICVSDRYLRMGNNLHKEGFQRITLRRCV